MIRRLADVGDDSTSEGVEKSLGFRECPAEDTIIVHEAEMLFLGVYYNLKKSRN